MSKEQNVASQWQRAFVLHGRPYSESSLIVSLFCEKQGAITAIAKGARTKRSAQKAYLQPFTPLLVKFLGKGEVKTLVAVEPISLTLPLSNTYLYSGIYLNELIQRVLESEVDCTLLYSEYLLAIQSLASQELSIEAVLRRFELILLKHLGYSVDFFHCAGSGQKIATDMTYIYYPEKGFVASMMNNKNVFLGQYILAMGHLDFLDKETLNCAKQFTRIALKPYVGSKPFKSRELFSQILPR
ncbi:DNA repair protein RecO [Thorsellia kenyensis]|uniref:DNA repair protein RecO n=1 Tax=Thorsellia kenyensis TaxID=1549888 RepID=A0ABV6C8Y4_9GAMM